MARPIRVLICDDSPLVRQILVSVFDADPQIEVVGTAEHPLIARTMIKQLNPDVLTLDIEMPEMDGLSFLEKIMALRPMPVVMISSLTQKGTAQSLKALELGVCDVVGKPTTNLQQNFQEISREILAKVKIAASARVRPSSKLKQRMDDVAKGRTDVKLIAIGASTGGVAAIKDVLPLLPLSTPPIIMVQHMPAAYTGGFAARMNDATRLGVVESQNGMKLETGLAIIANGSCHTRIVSKGTRLFVEHDEGPAVSGHKPSVDVLFESIAENVHGKIISVIMTGMGRDGARGMLSLRRKGAVTIGQSEESCVVYGMPKVAREVGGVETEVSLAKIATTIERICWPK